MSRYVLIPDDSSQVTKQTDGSTEVFSLIPIDGFNKKSKSVELPYGLNPYNNLYSKVRYKNKLKRLLMKLTKADIGQNKDGFVVNRNNVLEDINFNNAVSDSCNGNFSALYEKFYILLRKYGIVF